MAGTLGNQMSVRPLHPTPYWGLRRFISSDSTTPRATDTLRPIEKYGSHHHHHHRRHDLRCSPSPSPTAIARLSALASALSARTSVVLSAIVLFSPFVIDQRSSRPSPESSGIGNGTFTVTKYYARDVNINTGNALRRLSGRVPYMITTFSPHGIATDSCILTL